MRMRKKKNADARLLKCADLFLYDKPGELKNIYLEIGCGKGAFISQLALANPEKFLSALKKYPMLFCLRLKRSRKKTLKM